MTFELVVPEKLKQALEGKRLTKGMVIKEDNTAYMITRAGDGFYVVNLSSGFQHTRPCDTIEAVIEEYFTVADYNADKYEYTVYDSIQSYLLG